MELVPQSTKDATADLLHNFPDFKLDMIHGLFLGEDSGKYYFFNKGEIKILEEEYGVSNNLANFFSGPIVQTNKSLRYLPPKMILTEIEKLGSEETAPSFVLDKEFPFLAEALCLETMRRIEKNLTPKTGINGWNHFVIILENFLSKVGNKAFYFEGIDSYCFLSSTDILLYCDPDKGNYDWEWDETSSGFSIRKQTLIKLIERQKFL